MDFLMDSDDDFESEPIRDFLKNKLEEIKGENEKLQKTFRELEKETQKTINSVENSSKGILIQKSWLRLANDKYAIWYLVENKTPGILIDSHLILQWDSPEPISYISSMFLIPDEIAAFNKIFQCIETLKKKAHIVAVVNRPDFLLKLSIQISGMLACCGENGENFYIDLPKLTIESKDITNREIIVPVYKLIESNISNFSSWLVCSNKINLIQKLNGDIRETETVFEIDASLYRISFRDNDVGRFFLAHKISPSFDGCVLEIIADGTKEYNEISIYYRNQQSLLTFIHHLYQSISSLILLPEEFEIRLHAKSQKECEELLKKCILKEINTAKAFTKKRSTTKEDLKDFKLKLCDLEHKTDKAYIQLRIANDRCENEEICLQDI